MSIVMPRRFSSSRRSASIPVSAFTSEVLPWSICPAVPTMTDFICDSIDASAGRTLLSAAFAMLPRIVLPRIKINSNGKSSGQECPLYTSLPPLLQAGPKLRKCSELCSTADIYRQFLLERIGIAARGTDKFHVLEERLQCFTVVVENDQTVS